MKFKIPTDVYVDVISINNVLVNTSSGKKKVKRLIELDFVEFVILQDPKVRYQSLDDFSGVSAIKCKQTDEWYLSENIKNKALMFRPIDRS